MKIQSSMKVTKNFSHVFRCGYCDLQNILPRSVFDPVYYNTGVYGWNNDMYVDYHHDAIITTGYRNMRGTCIPQKALDFYNDRALRISKWYKDGRITWDEMKEAYYNNFQKFVAYLITWEKYPDVLPCDEC